MRINRRKLKNIAFNLLYLTRSYIITRPAYSGAGTILALHRVCPKSKRKRILGNSGSEITPEVLDRIIRFFIDQNYEIISLDQMFQVLKDGMFDKKFVVFTFDDGYADNLIYAYPVFKKYGIPFTIYVTTSFPDRQAVLWWDLLEDLVLQEDRIYFEIENETVELDCSTTVEKENTFQKIRSLIINNYGNDHLEQVRKIFGPYGVDLYGKTDKLALSWEQIEQLSMDPLVTVGAHTVNHFALSKLSRSNAKHEIMGSKRKLESRIGRNVEHFTYPFGTRNEAGEREFKIVRECGFKTATTARPGNIFFAHRGHMECLPRALISGEREGKNIQYLNLWVNGAVNCVTNKFRKVVTL